MNKSSPYVHHIIYALPRRRCGHKFYDLPTFGKSHIRLGPLAAVFPGSTPTIALPIGVSGDVGDGWRLIGTGLRQRI